MIEITILWEDGQMFLASLPGEQMTEAEAVDEIADQIARGAVLYGRFCDTKGVPQEQFRLARLYERGIRAVMVNYR
jgi:hypothetical protein